MAWGKIIGGAVGAMFGGPIGAGIGVAIGAGFDGAAGDDLTIDAESLQESLFTVTRNGNIVRLVSAIELPPHATDCVVRVGWNQRCIQSAVSPLADEDGDFVLTPRVIERHVAFEIPLHALRITPGSELAAVVAVVIYAGDNAIDEWRVPLRIQAIPEQWSVVRWLCPVIDLMAHYALLSGSWTPEKVQFIKEAAKELGGNTPQDSTVLRDRLKLSSRPSWNECVDAINVRFSRDDVTRFIAPLIVLCIQRFGLAGRSFAPELQKLGGRLYLTPREIADVMTHFEPSNDDDETDWNEDTSDHHHRSGSTGGSADRRSASTEKQWAGEILGVDSHASQDVVQKAWRKKISELHPDKYAGLPESVQQLIKDKAQDINRARDMLLA